MKTTEKQKEQLKEVVRLELLKRGFTAEIETFEIDNEKRKINFKTKNFQTTPVIFKECHIGCFSSGIDEEGAFWIIISFYYTTFDNGKNGVKLFSINGLFALDDIFHLKTDIYQ